MSSYLRDITLEIDIQKVYHHLTNYLEDFKEFACHIIEYIEVKQ